MYTHEILSRSLFLLPSDLTCMPACHCLQVQELLQQVSGLSNRTVMIDTCKALLAQQPADVISQHLQAALTLQGELLLSSLGEYIFGHLSNICQTVQVSIMRLHCYTCADPEGNSRLFPHTDVSRPRRHLVCLPPPCRGGRHSTSSWCRPEYSTVSRVRASSRCRCIQQQRCWGSSSSWGGAAAVAVGVTPQAGAAAAWLCSRRCTPTHSRERQPTNSSRRRQGWVRGGGGGGTVVLRPCQHLSSTGLHAVTLPGPGLNAAKKNRDWQQMLVAFIRPMCQLGCDLHHSCVQLCSLATFCGNSTTAVVPEPAVTRRLAVVLSAAQSHMVGAVKQVLPAHPSRSHHTWRFHRLSAQKPDPGSHTSPKTQPAARN